MDAEISLYVHDLSQRNPEVCWPEIGSTLALPGESL
jgi:hypothetical protein